MGPDLRRAALLAAAALLAVAVPSRAEVQGSPHDIIPQGYDVLKTGLSEDRCTRCHLPVSTDGPNLLRQVPPSLQRHSPASLLCFSCHDGTTIVSPEVDASATAFHPASHAMAEVAEERRPPEGVGLPLAPGYRIDCVTCHDPHTNTHRPFLRAERAELCLVCHGAYAETSLGRDNLTGNHVLAADPLGPGRPEAPLRVGPDFRTPLPKPYPQQLGRGTPGVHWDLGGHLTEGAAGGLACTTCHAVHGDEQSPPRSRLLPVDPVRETADLFCEGCHRGERGDGLRAEFAPNPGGTVTPRTYHPADDASRGLGPPLPVAVPPEWPAGGAERRTLFCTSCHTPHGARASTPLLRPLVVAAAFCEECHQGLPEYHHPVGPDPQGACASQVPAPGPGEDAGLTCARCHRAHNAGLGSERERDFIPLLRFGQEGDAACTPCHPTDNPTCGTRPEYLASHFLGDPALRETYGDDDPPLLVEPWPESRLPSRYGGKRSQTVLCLSCHAFQAGVVTSGDDGTAGYLLARSGNKVEWEPGEEPYYLCTGCHGGNPTTGEKEGHTHPLMDADLNRLGRMPLLPVTGTPSARINCDSCHRPHEAATAGGYFILETIDSANTDPKAVHPLINYTVICHRCHDPEKY